LTIGKGKRPGDPNQLAKWTADQSMSATPELEGSAPHIGGTGLWARNSCALAKGKAQRTPQYSFPDQTDPVPIS
jgi:hypothetical protein